MLSSENKDCSQEISELTADKALYSLSVLDFATMAYFLEDQETKLLLRKMQ